MEAPLSGIPDRPTIGITADVIPRGHRFRYSVYNTYAEAVRRTGGFPIGVFPGDLASIPAVLEAVDGILLPGGDDLHPRHWGEEDVHPEVTLSSEERTLFELDLIRTAKATGIPLLGVCLGFQAMNVALGGSIVQHLDPALGHGSGEGGLAEAREHEIHVESGTLLERLIGCGAIRVNSGHHQGVGRIGSGLRIAAKAGDGVVEALEAEDGSFFVGVQWHPEERLKDEASRAIFQGLIDAATRTAGHKGTSTPS